MATIAYLPLRAFNPLWWAQGTDADWAKRNLDQLAHELDTSPVTPRIVSMFKLSDFTPEEWVHFVATYREADRSGMVWADVRAEIESEITRRAGPMATVRSDLVRIIEHGALSDGERYLIVPCLNGWDQALIQSAQVLQFDGANYAWTGWDSDKKISYFRSKSLGFARLV